MHADRFRSLLLVATSFAAIAPVGCRRTPDTAGSSDDEIPPARSPVAGITTPSDTVLLNANGPALDNKNDDAGLLIRELIRQALLIAARDGLGLATRDVALREPVPQASSAGLPALDIRTRAVIGKHLLIQITWGPTPEEQNTWKKAIPLKSADYVDYPELTAAAEALSRTELLDVLKAAGFQGTGNPQPSNSDLPQADRQDLASMSFLPQFAAVRRIHSQIRRNGQSPVFLGALVRAYANLGQLTQFYWNASPVVFTARALLYAERMVAADPKSAWALHHRAYARALAGLHADALADLDKARTLAGSANDPAAPTWTKWIHAYCRYDTAALAAAEQDTENRDLALFLAFLAVEHADSTCVTYAAAEKLVKACPECYRAYDAMCDLDEIGISHVATTAAPQTLFSTLPDRLLDMPDLPAGVKALLPAPGAKAPSPPSFIGTLARVIRSLPAPDDPEQIRKDTPKIVQTLVDAGTAPADKAEPSWGLLGRMVEERVFLHVQRRGYFMRYSWSVPVEDFLRESAPLIERHPYQALIRTYALNLSRQSDAWHALFDTTEIVDARLPMMPLIRAMAGINRNGRTPGNEAWWAAVGHADEITFDLENLHIILDKKKRPYVARKLRRVSPHSPLPIMSFIWWDWSYAEPQVEQWAATYGQHPCVTGALGFRYKELRRLDDAERWLKLHVRQAPDKWGYDMLADIYFERGDDDKYLRTLEESLTGPDLGLSHTCTRVKIAWYFMNRNQWEKALPYAQAAAESWSGSSMVCLNRCYEGLEHWDLAEKWIRNVSERYDESRSDWYLWCKRTGKGDQKAARQLALQYIGKIAPNAVRADLDRAGIIHMLGGRHAEALEAFRRTFEQSPSPYSGLHYALLADRLGQVESRNKTLDNIADEGNTYPDTGESLTQQIRLADLFRKALTANPAASLNLDAANDLVRAAAGGERTNMLVFIAMFLDLHGSAEQANVWYDRAVTLNHTGKWNHILACDRLRQQGFDAAWADVETAQNHIAAGQWKQALTLAESAAKTGSAAALLCLARCHEGLGQWAEAERTVRTLAERYHNFRLAWFLWCKRTGKGDLAAAYALADRYIQAVAKDPWHDDYEETGILHLLSDRPPQALAAFQKAHGVSNSPYDGLFCALLAAQLGDTAARDKALDLTVTEGYKYLHNDQPYFLEIQLADLFRRALAQRPAAGLDTDAADSLIQRGEPAEKTDLLAFIGCFLDCCGSSDQAAEYLRRAVRANSPHRWTHALACHLLRKKGLDPAQPQQPSTQTSPSAP